MTRLSDLHGELAKGAAVRWDPRPVDVLSVVQTARTQRSEFIADLLRHGIESFGRWSGLTPLVAVLRNRLQRRRTLRSLAQLDNRMLSDIGLTRADILATATVSSDKPSACDTVWHQLAAWASRRLHYRKTLRELSAMSDEMLDDIGIARAEIPAIAASLAAERSKESQHGATTEVSATAEVLAFVEVRRSLRRAANQNSGRSNAA